MECTVKNKIALGIGIALMGLTSMSRGATSYSETSTATVPSFGIQAGLNFENASTPAQINANSRTGFTIGVNMNFPISTAFSIQPELNYSRRGWDLINTGGIRASINQHAIEVPVLAKLAFGEAVRPYIFAGPMGTWNVSNELVGDIGGTGKSISYNPRTFDVALVGGLGVEAGAFFANARYQLGVVDINANSSSYQSRGFKLLAGLKF